MTPPSQKSEEALEIPTELVVAIAEWWRARAMFACAAVAHLLATRHRQGLPEHGPDADRASAATREQAKKEFAWMYPFPVEIHTSGHSA